MSDNYTKGSEGSLICKTNLRKYPLEETKPLDQYSPSETDHKLEVNESAFRMPAELEVIRRQNNRARDRRHRWAVLTAPISVDTNSDAEQYAEKVSGKKD